jgi:hypothetical protein
MQDKRYLKCLQLHGQQAAPRANAAATAGTFATFDVPGSTCLPRFILCTHPYAINPAGAVTGIYADAIGAMHGFLRAPDGTFTNIDVPGSVCPFFFSFCTQPTGINPAGAITGNGCCGASFLRAPDGTFTTFNPPGSQFTQANGINPAGAITGSYFDENFVGHGFLRAPGGTFTTFDAPGADNGTFPSAINPAGVITGSYDDANFVQHGFLRAPDGTLTTFDPAGSIFT